MYYISDASLLIIGVLIPTLCSGALLCTVLAWSRSHPWTAIWAKVWASVGALISIVGCSIILIIGAAQEASGSGTSRAAESSSSSAASSSRYSLDRKLQFAFFPLAVLAIGFVRLFVILLYIRLFSLGVTLLRFLWKGLAALEICWTVTFLFGSIFQCGNHISSFWTADTSLYRNCANSSKILASLSITDLVIDVICLLLPFYLIWRLRMDVRRKWRLSASLGGTAVLSTLLAVTRTVFFVQYLRHGNLNTGSSDDLDKLAVPIWWTYLQIGVAYLSTVFPVASNFVWGYIRRSWNGLKTGSMSIDFRSSSRRTPFRSSEPIMSRTPAHVSQRGPGPSRPLSTHDRWARWLESGLRKYSPADFDPPETEIVFIRYPAAAHISEPARGDL